MRVRKRCVGVLAARGAKIKLNWRLDTGGPEEIQGYTPDETRVDLYEEFISCETILWMGHVDRIVEFQ
ncbi:hypothetical protein NDU88_000820 [Pleurodeles waltl]|uniref:Uncharacterized protein n=1 Tax=Pleurodeles waltl TaxID=8319 RepID=A0AAV7USX2_PLEWA|nr:hypothetical protein NDU88_000820 [Pleurodeles waltl]